MEKLPVTLSKTISQRRQVRVNTHLTSESNQAKQCLQTSLFCLQRRRMTSSMKSTKAITFGFADFGSNYPVPVYILIYLRRVFNSVEVCSQVDIGCLINSKIVVVKRTLEKNKRRIFLSQL